MRVSAKTIRSIQRTGYEVVRLVLGCVLLAAAGLKAHQLATEPLAATDLLHSRWFLLIEVEFELLFGLWLLAGVLPRVTWAVALMLFLGFALVSLYQALIGRASCGCFGRVPVSPWYTYGFDVAAVAALLCCRPRSDRPPARRSTIVRGAIVVGAWLLVGIPVAIAMATYAPAAISPSGDLLGDEEFVVLEPEKWLGEPFPLVKHVDVGDQLAQGDWVVLLYNHDCPSCQEMLPWYLDLARELAARGEALKVALIEVPQPGREFHPPELNGAPCLVGHLSREREWFVSPVELRVKDGIVAEVVPSEGLGSGDAESRAAGVP